MKDEIYLTVYYCLLVKNTGIFLLWWIVNSSLTWLKTSVSATEKEKISERKENDEQMT